MIGLQSVVGSVPSPFIPISKMNLHPISMTNLYSRLYDLPAHSRSMIPYYYNSNLLSQSI